MSGWLIDNSNGGHYYDLSQVTYDAEVNICRNQDLKYDVQIEDC